MLKHLRTPLFCYWVHKTNSLAIQHWQFAKYVHLSFVFRRFSRSWHFPEFFNFVFVLIFFQILTGKKSEVRNCQFLIFRDFWIFLKNSYFLFMNFVNFVYFCKVEVEWLEWKLFRFETLRNHVRRRLPANWDFQLWIKFDNDNFNFDFVWSTLDL